MQIPYWLSRTELLLTAETTQQLMHNNVLVVGLGGVGGICAEMLVRAGVSNLTIADADTIDLSNCNRQIPALHSTAGMLKTEVMKARLLDINPALKLTIVNQFINATNVTELLSAQYYNYAVDCIDTLSPKAAFIAACLAHQLPVVSSLGAGGKLNPALVTVADISQTKQCNLARYVRKKLQAMGIKTGVICVYSPELIDNSRVIVSEKAYPKKSLVGTISYMPAIFGCYAASVVIQSLLAKKN